MDRVVGGLLWSAVGDRNRPESIPWLYYSGGAAAASYKDLDLTASFSSQPDVRLIRAWCFADLRRLRTATCLLCDL
jgi:hypothetical protein